MIQPTSISSKESLNRLFRELEAPLSREVMWYSYSRLSNGIARVMLRSKP